MACRLFGAGDVVLAAVGAVMLAPVDAEESQSMGSRSQLTVTRDQRLCTENI